VISKIFRDGSSEKDRLLVKKGVFPVEILLAQLAEHLLKRTEDIGSTPI
jgi:hypothetical protein